MKMIAKIKIIFVDKINLTKLSQNIKHLFITTFINK